MVSINDLVSGINYWPCGWYLNLLVVYLLLTSRVVPINYWPCEWCQLLTLWMVDHVSGVNYWTWKWYRLLTLWVVSITYWTCEWYGINYWPCKWYQFITLCLLSIADLKMVSIADLEMVAVADLVSGIYCLPCEWEVITAQTKISVSNACIKRYGNSYLVSSTAGHRHNRDRLQPNAAGQWRSFIENCGSKKK